MARKLQVIKSKKGSLAYFLNIPIDIIRLKGWQQGDKIDFKADEKGNLILKKI